MQQTISEMQSRQEVLKKQLQTKEEERVAEARKKQLLETTILQLKVESTAKEAQLQEELTKINHQLIQSQTQHSKTQEILAEIT